MAGCMMCTTMSAQSTSTHSPLCSPSTPTISAPAAFTASRTCCANAFTCRLDSAVAMISVSYRLVSLRTSSNVMSRALMSSRAVTAVFCRRLRRIRSGPIQLVAFNICQNRRRKQTRHLGAASGSPFERGANGRGRDRLRRHAYAHDGAGELARKASGIGRQPALPLLAQWRRKRRHVERRAGALDHDEMCQREQLLPAMPARESLQRVGAEQQRERAIAILVVQFLQRNDRVARSGAADLAIVGL